jgi:hypothetical protein
MQTHFMTETSLIVWLETLYTDVVQIDGQYAFTNFRKNSYAYKLRFHLSKYIFLFKRIAELLKDWNSIKT